MPFRFAILDDYQSVATRMADWDTIRGAEVVSFADHIADHDEIVARLAGFDGVLLMRERTGFPADLLRRLPQLRLIVTTGMKNAAIDVAAARAQGITVCGTRSNSVPPAELAWTLALALLRGLPAQLAAARGAHWQADPGREAAGRVLGLVGLGKIGQMMARYAKAFDMKVIAWSPNLTAERAAAAGVVAVPKLQLFAEADVISLHLRAGPSTFDVVGAAEIAAMKPSAFLVNTSRAELVDEAPLVAALRAGRIAGAAVDVFREEPAPADHPLLTLSNVIATPHVGYVTEENYALFFGDAAECLARFLAGDPVRLVE